MSLIIYFLSSYTEHRIFDSQCKVICCCNTLSFHFFNQIIYVLNEAVVREEESEMKRETLVWGDEPYGFNFILLARAY